MRFRCWVVRRRCRRCFFLVVDADRVGTWRLREIKRMKGIREALKRLVSMHDTGSIASPTWNCRTPLLVPRHCQFGHSKTKLLTTNEGNNKRSPREATHSPRPPSPRDNLKVAPVGCRCCVTVAMVIKWRPYIQKWCSS